MLLKSIYQHRWRNRRWSVWRTKCIRQEKVLSCCRQVEHSFLDMAEECSELTLPYLVTQDDDATGKRTLLQPYQSVGAKAVVTLAAKLMLAMLPPQTAFFKLQVRDDKLGEDTRSYDA